MEGRMMCLGHSEPYRIPEPVLTEACGTMSAPQQLPLGFSLLSA